MLCALLAAVLSLGGTVSATEARQKEESLYLGGMAFGVKYFTKGVLVVGLCRVEGYEVSVCPAKEAGVEKGDILLKANGSDIDSAQTLSRIIGESEGNGVSLELMRGDKSLQVTVYPALSAEDNGYKGGMWVRDSTAGIGTVTYIKADGSFGALGHGICDGDTGTLMPLGNGAVVDVDIKGARKGAAGSPGELKGELDNVKRGTVTANTEKGLFGTLTAGVPKGAELMPIGDAHSVKKGQAQICSTVDGETRRYSIEIEEVSPKDGDTRNMLIRVTDKALLEKTGGIVQGMSGSPIIQNGKIVGAVTHVLVGDPTRGYGIFIRNMLNAAR